MNDRPLILVVDDDPRIATAIGRALRTAGLQVLTAPDALEAVSIARSARPSAILMDVMMPGMEGSVAAALMKDCVELREIPIILVSALPEEELQCRAAEVGAAGWVAKPFRRVDLLRALQPALALSACEQAG
jgi:CheY-like chemotaxis protein